MIEHLESLSSTGAPAVQWSVHIAVDAGEAIDGDGGNVMGYYVDRPGKLSKRGESIGTAGHVLVTDDAANTCSAEVREASWMHEMCDSVSLVDEGRDGFKHPRTVVRVALANADEAVRWLAKRLRSTAEQLEAASPQLRSDEMDLREQSDAPTERSLEGSD